MTNAILVDIVSVVMRTVITQPPKEKMDTVSALQARKQFGRLLDKAFYQDEGVVVKRAGTEMAVILPMSVFRWMLQVRSRIADDFFAYTEQLRKAFSGMSEGEIEALVDEAVIAVRAEERAKNAHK